MAMDPELAKIVDQCCVNARPFSASLGSIPFWIATQHRAQSLKRCLQNSVTFFFECKCLKGSLGNLL